MIRIATLTALLVVSVMSFSQSRQDSPEKEFKRYKHHLNVGTGLTITGGFLAAGGAICLATVPTVTYPKWDIENKGNEKGRLLMISGITMSALAIPFIVIGPIEIAKFNRYAKRASQKEVSLVLLPASIQLTF